MCIRDRYLRVKGGEVGTTTGRTRRCGWFDAVALRRSAFNNSMSGLCITKMDVLDELDVLRICVGYRVDGERTESLPVGAEGYAEIEPIYEEMPGWRSTTAGMDRFEDLPRAARDYLARISDIAGVPVQVVSTGPDRAHTMVLEHPFD